MNFQIIKILGKHYLRKTSQYVALLTIFLVGTLVSTFPVKWDYARSSVTFFGFPLELYGHSRQESLLTLLNEFFSWAWIIIAILYLPRLLRQLSESFSVKEMLWLRLVPCSPYEVAVARACWVGSWAFLLGALGTVWALICSLFHQIPSSELFVNIEGLVGHVLLSGGIVVGLNSVIAVGESDQNSISVIALLTPLILTPIYLGINRVSVTNYMKFFPYAIPFNKGLQNTLLHFGIAALIGVLFLCLHTVWKFRFSHVKITIEE
jgi:hypothetical protein